MIACCVKVRSQVLITRTVVLKRTPRGSLRHSNVGTLLGELGMRIDKWHLGMERENK